VSGGPVPHGAADVHSVRGSGRGAQYDSSYSPQTHEGAPILGSSQIAVVIKTTHACNLACTYCYSRPGGSMSEEILQASIRKCLSEWSDVKFIFHGGEPLLSGLSFFEKALNAIACNRSPEARVSIHVQTNAVLIDEGWLDLFVGHGVNVGVSLDGPAHLHDAFRVFPDGSGTHDAVVESIRKMRHRGIQVGALAVITPLTSRQPIEVMRYFESSPWSEVDFLPCTRPSECQTRGCDSAVPSTPPGELFPHAYADFILKAFRHWLFSSSSRLPVRFFSEILKSYAGYQASLCSLAPQEHCGRHTFTIDSDGCLYFCDDFIGEEEWRIGHILDDSLESVFRSERYHALRSRILKMPPTCLECRWLSSCGGGCSYHRYLASPELHQRSIFCESIRKIMDYLHTNVVGIGG
jgi:uncharacterized protein